MRPQISIIAPLVILSSLASSGIAENWPGFRGPRGDGTSLEKQVPVHWSASSNVVWKTAIPGEGHASPIVWKDRIFLVTALADKEERVLLCVDAKDGAILWQQVVVKSPLEQKRNENSYASSTPATDGTRVYVSFLDRNDVVVAAYDFSGKQVWMVRPGTFSSPHGYCSAPVVYHDKLLLNCGSKGDSFLAALSVTDGKTLWKSPQPNHSISYSTPLVREVSGKAQMIHTGDGRVAALNPDDGSVIWTVSGPSTEFIASPAFGSSGLAFIGSSFPERILEAIKTDGHGDVTSTHVVWRSNQGAPQIVSPIVEGDYLLTISSAGVLQCYEAATGKILWSERLTPHHASPVSANDLIYMIDDNGVVTVIRPGPTFDRVARNEIGEKSYATPAISNGRLYLRGGQDLFCIAEK